jgi:hypothetical protein
VLVHGVSAEDRLAVLAADHPHAARRAVQRPPDRVDARGADQE